MPMIFLKMMTSFFFNFSFLLGNHGKRLNDGASFSLHIFQKVFIWKSVLYVALCSKNLFL